MWVDTTRKRVKVTTPQHTTYHTCLSPTRNTQILNRSSTIDHSTNSSSSSTTNTFIMENNQIKMPKSKPAKISKQVVAAARKVRGLSKSMVRLLHFLCTAGRRFLLVHPHVSPFWEVPEVGKFLSLSGISANQCGSVGELWAVHNFLSLSDFSEPGCDTKGVCVSAIDSFVARSIGPEVNKYAEGELPHQYDDRVRWVFSQLRASTRGFSHDASSMAGATSILRWLSQMVPGQELDHLSSLYREIDLRGSDVRLDTGSFLTVGRQSMPYPAFAWDWTVTQSYTWASHQHINVLELVAFFNYLRAFTLRKWNQSVRFVHVLDSMVCSAVLAKGRSSSSSRVLNRSLRRIAALLIAADASVIPVWTISGWIFSDAGSRYDRPPDPG